MLCTPRHAYAFSAVRADRWKTASGVDLTDRLRAINMNASLSGSSNSNDESDSGAVEDIEDEDLEMSSPSGTPLIAFPCAVQSFPQAAYVQLTEGLNRLPSWTVFPASLADCLAATVEIAKHFGRHVMSHYALPNLGWSHRRCMPVVKLSLLAGAAAAAHRAS